MNMRIKRAQNGLIYLNVGCGSTYDPEWNNADLFSSENVVYVDIRRPLPWSAGVFDVVYSSHVLEHLTPPEGRALMQELFRVCRPGAVCRMVVPDYERAARAYLQCLEDACRDPSPRPVRRYQWSVLEMIDQYVRRKNGGLMREVLSRGDFDEEYVRLRNGDEFFAPGRGTADASRSLRAILRNFWPVTQVLMLRRWWRARRFVANEGYGELHRWAYDRLSLRQLLESAGFSQIKRQTHESSDIPDWSRYALDTAANGAGDRKPDSLYMEARKTG
jgi:predicted SAM-dependent methyltransferase